MQYSRTTSLSQQISSPDTSLVDFIETNVLKKIIIDEIMPGSSVSYLNPQSGGSMVKALTTNIPSVNGKGGFNPMSHWKACFTSPLYSSRSYEPFETTGDLIVNFMWGFHSQITYKDMTPSEISGFKSFYADNAFSAYLIDKLKENAGIDLMSRLHMDSDVMEVLSPVIVKIKADLFEAIFGTLYLVGSQLDIGLGMTLCTTWFYFILNACKVETIRSIGHSYTYLTQLFDVLGFSGKNGPVFIHQDVIEDRKTIGVSGDWYLPEPILAFLRQEMISGKLTGPRAKNIADLRPIYKNDKKEWVGGDPLRKSEREIASKPIKGTTRELSATYAMEFLASYGVTPEWANKIKTVLDTITLDDDVREKFEKKLEDEGYVSFSIKKNSKYSTKKESTVQLFGKTRDDVEKLLLTVISQEYVPKIKTNIIRYYIQQEFKTGSIINESRRI